MMPFTITRSVGSSPVLDDAQTVDHLARRHVFLAHDIVLVDDQHVFARLLGTDRGLGNQQRIVGRRARHADTPEHAGREHAVGVGEHAATADRARRAIDDVVDEVHLALVHEIGLVDQLHRDDDAALATGDFLSGLRQPLVADIRRFVEGELEPDRIDRHDGGEQRGIAAGAAGHEIARRDAPVADAAGDRRAQFGEFEVERGLANRRLLRGDRGFGDALGLGALVEGLLGDGLVAHELRGAREIGLGKGEVGPRLRQVGLGLVERGLERALVDREQEVALLDDLAVGEMDAVEIAGHARAHLDRVDGDEAADILVIVDDVAFDRRRDRDGRRRRGRARSAGLRCNRRSGARTARRRTESHWGFAWAVFRRPGVRRSGQI